MVDGFGYIDLCPHTKVPAFLDQLKAGHLVASRCDSCGASAFPPRADCSHCMGERFGLVELSGRGIVVTFTRIDAAPAGFEDFAPYTLGVVDLEEGDRLLAWFGKGIPETAIEIGMRVQVVPRVLAGPEGSRTLYTLERPGPSDTLGPAASHSPHGGTAL